MPLQREKDSEREENKVVIWLYLHCMYNYCIKSSCSHSMKAILVEYLTGLNEEMHKFL